MRRTNRNGLKRIGVLALALVIALGSLGVAYAAWTDSVYIEGTVETGTVDILVIASSSTFVYKVPGAPDEIVVNYCSGHDDQNPPAGDEGVDYFEIASAVTTFVNSGTDADTATMAFSGLFPGVEFKADLQMLYAGSIPAKVSVATILDPDKAQDATLAELWDLWQYGDSIKGYAANTYGIWMEGVLTANDVARTETHYVNPLGVQIHQYEQLNITLHVLLPQDDDYQNLSNLGFTGLITVVQWNEYAGP
ncbi:hypothetical protein ES708_08464 [subsurface metagenome]